MPRPIPTIKADLSEAKSALARLESDAEEVVRSAGDAELTDGQQTRLERIETGARRKRELIRALEGELRDSAVDGVTSGRLRGENGAGVRPGNGPEIMRRVEPYQDDLPALRDGRYNDGDVISRALKAVEVAPAHMDDKAREHVQRLVDVDDSDENRQAALIARHMLMTGSPGYHEQFREYMRTRGAYAGELLRASMTLTDANGGFLVPFTLDPTIILTNAGIMDPLRQISTIKQIATDSWNGVTSSGVTASWTAEGAEASDGTPTFAQPTITPKRADAWVEGTYEVLADSGFANQLGRLLADAKARHEGAAFATANVGATRPRGVVAAVAAVTASIVASAATNALAIGDVYNVSDALRPRDAAQASWLANKKIYSRVRQFDTSGGGSFWANLGMGRPRMLLDAPAYEASTMQSAVTTGGLVLLAGNFAEYYIVDRIGMSVQYNPMLMGLTTGRPTGKAGWLALWRVGADVVDVDAFRLLQLNAVASNVPLA
ncbi:phage major capsid protein [Phytohabitans sp. ZYX-F-186]|uniref:Phage major capsid protein n=1 Tax=Phytohabitans maris TaxID=3071409 RepID=A0ABU0ZUZ1_9ACTN|nr:phage major capsid protein [Phytohabitans sp. ZYX-F-186]MDQ7910763.1 phage major capsid protein [Phytohabitans sp. ZYX-F-186]